MSSFNLKAVNPSCSPNAILRARPVAPPPELRPFFDRYAEILLELARDDLKRGGAVLLSAPTASPASDTGDVQISPSPGGCDAAGGIRADVSQAGAPGGAHSSPAVSPASAAASPAPPVTGADVGACRTSQRLPCPGRRRRFPSRLGELLRN